jgi:uncharacterized membrane protein YgcG
MRKILAPIKVKALLRPAALLAALLGALALLLAGVPVHAASERILNFQSHVVIHPDSSMTVTEDITVRATGASIKRGIIREFPTTYQDRAGHTVKVGFRVDEVYRDGTKEPYHLSQVTNGVKIYVGKQDVFLQPGVYNYTIKYTTSRQLGYFQDFDELYWNVTGNGWTFAIDAAEAVIDLPPGAKVLQEAAYTGYKGAQGKNYTVRRGDGYVIFRTTRALAPHEGLTIAVAWPKGLVRQPTALEQDPTTFVALGGLLLLVGFYFFAWVKVGRDPAPGTIIPLFTPPQGYSPAAVRFIERLGFDHKAFAAAVVDMAVKGALLIQEDDGDYTLVRKAAGAASLSKGEQRLAAELFGGRESIKLENENHTYIKKAIDALKSYLKSEFQKNYFATNSMYLVPGLAITLAVLGAIVLFAPDTAAAAFSSLWLLVWTVACFFLAVTVYRKWQLVLGGGFRFGNFIAALGTTFFASFFFAGEILGSFFMVKTVSLPAVLLLAAMGLANALFYHLLKAPTQFGRKIMDQIEGFKMYLSVAEKERLEMLHPPEKTPELFEKYLPYALALEVENQWSEQFAGVLAQAGVGGQPYSPSWYSGSSWDRFDSSRFGSSLGNAFSGAISAASSPPGSSSGSGGGGSSGGGGGGGGGSGW